jgi:RNA polymerase subunit RPABC4/transcription elongation factor Spt4
MKCYDCDTELLENWNYCPNCKRKLRKNKIVEEEFIPCDEKGKCHNCSCVLDDKWNFCPVCGTNAEFYSDKAFVSVPVLAASDVVNTTVPSVNEVQINETAPVKRYCANCGTEALEEHVFCAICGHSLSENKLATEEKNEETKDQGNGYIIWILVAYLSPILCGYLTDIHEIFALIGSVVGLFSIVYAKATYKNNKIVNIFFWLYIALGILTIAAGLLMAFFVVAACKVCIGELAV